MPQLKSQLYIPREEILLSCKYRIEAYLEKSLKIIILLASHGIEIKDLSFYRFLNPRCENHIRKNITVRLPETDPGECSQADFGYMGMTWDEPAVRMRKTYALILALLQLLLL